MPKDASQPLSRHTSKSHVSCRIALIGFGAVAQAFVRLLRSKSKDLLDNQAVKFDIACVYTRRKGFAYNLAPLACLDYEWLLSEYAQYNYSFSIDQSLPSMKVLQQTYGVDIVIETIPINYRNAEPALSLAEDALKNGLHLVTANKAVVVHGYRGRLKAWGSQRILSPDTALPQFLFESAVMDGVPIFNLTKHCLRGARITGYRGVLNSTCNLILTRMEQTRCPLEKALEICQQLGITETDASGDIDGHDSMVKTCALATVLFNTDVQSDAETASIRQVSLSQIDDCKTHRNTRLKVVCEAFLVPDSTHQKTLLNISVKLTEVPPDSIFYALDGASSAIEIYSQELAPICITSTEPKTADTAFGLLSDCLDIASKKQSTGDKDNNLPTAGSHPLQHLD